MDTVLFVFWLFCFVFRFSFVYYNFLSFFPAYFLHRNCLWKPLQKMPTVVLNKGSGKLFRGEIWVECHCGILDLEADRGGLGWAGLGWARQGFPLCQLRWHHYRMRGAPSLFLWCFLSGCHSARKPCFFNLYALGGWRGAGTENQRSLGVAKPDLHRSLYTLCRVVPGMTFFSRNCLIFYSAL